MTILYFYQYFSTPKGSWGTRVNEFAADWVKKGHEVIVVTSVYDKSDLKVNHFLETQYFDGIQVKIINVKIDNKQSFFRRVISFLQYAFISSWYALILKADVVIASSGPITVGIPGLVAKYIRGRKLVFEARDLWPEGAIALGIIKNKTIQSLAYWFEKKCYKASSLIVALSPGMKDSILQKHTDCHVIDVTNAANIPLFSTTAPFDGRGILEKKKYAIYTGNIGDVNNSWWLLNAAKLLQVKGNTSLKIVLVGEGQQRQELEAEAGRLGLTNFIRWNLIPKIDLVGLVQNALVSLVPLKGIPVLDTSSPNKFFESLAAGVPVIQNTQGWMKKFIEQHQVGFTIRPDDANGLANKLIELEFNEVLLHEMGCRAMDIARQEFNKEKLADKMLNAILEIK